MTDPKRPLPPARPSPLSLLKERLRLRGPLHEPPAAGATDYYGSVTHFAAQSTGRGYVIAPPHPVAPEPQRRDMDRWQWLAQPGASFAMLSNGFGSGVSTGAHRVACALELLSGLMHADAHPAAARRLMSIGSKPPPQDASARSPNTQGSLLRPDTQFMRKAWCGLFLMMSHCLDAAGARWEDIPPEHFPLLGGTAHSVSLLSAWPGGYASWIAQVERLDPKASLELWVDPRLQREWGQAARLAPAVRRGGATRDWVDSISGWTARGPVEDRRVQLMSTRPSDGLLGLSWGGIGRPRDRAPEHDPTHSWQHASPLALLMAAMAADAYLVGTSRFLELDRRMNSPTDEARQPYPDYDSVWITTSKRLRDVLTGPKGPRSPAPPSIGRATDRFITAAHPTDSVFTERPLALDAQIRHGDDEGTVRVSLPMGAMGTRVEHHLQQWEARAVPCFVEVVHRLSGRSEPFGLAATIDQWRDGTEWHAVVSPHLPAESSWHAVAAGRVDPRLAATKAWLVNGAADGAEPFPVLVLRVELLTA